MSADCVQDICQLIRHLKNSDAKTQRGSESGFANVVVFKAHSPVSEFPSCKGFSSYPTSSDSDFEEADSLPTTECPSPIDKAVDFDFTSSDFKESDHGFLTPNDSDYSSSVESSPTSSGCTSPVPVPEFTFPAFTLPSQPSLPSECVSPIPEVSEESEAPPTFAILSGVVNAPSAASHVVRTELGGGAFRIDVVPESEILKPKVKEWSPEEIQRKNMLANEWQEKIKEMMRGL